MSSGFGFTRFPQTPSPDPRQVGQALARSRMPQPVPGYPGGGPQGAMMEEEATGYGPASEVRDPLRLRLLGAIRTGGAGQTGTGSAPPGEPNYATNPDGDEALVNAAIGEALTRIGGGLMRPPDMTAARTAARHRQLLRLGLTPLEVKLLSRSGGI